MPPHPRRPVPLQPRHLNRAPVVADGGERLEAAHVTAQAVVNRGRTSPADAEVLARLVSLGDAEGIDDLALLWADSPADTLPGALWRLYLLRQWITQEPARLAEWYRIGAGSAEVADAVAGVEQPPGPQEVAHLADAVLTGAVSADLDVALDRAGAFCAVVATGTSLAAAAESSAAAAALVARADRLRSTSRDLAAAARLARAGQLS